MVVRALTGDRWHWLPTSRLHDCRQLQLPQLVTLTNASSAPTPRLALDRRRPARRARGAAPAAQGRGLRDRDRRARRPACSPRVEARDFDAVLMDLNYARDTTSGREGLDLLSELQALDATLPVVVMTAWGSVDRPSRRCAAARATTSRSRGTTRGCWRPSGRRSSWGGRCARSRRLESENQLLRARRPCRELIAESAAMQPVLAADGARGAVGRQRADHRRARHRQGGRGAAGSTRPRRARRSRFVAVNWAASPRASSRASCSAT